MDLKCQRDLEIDFAVALVSTKSIRENNMSMSFEVLEAEIMELGQEERERMLAKLIASKTHADEIESDWIDEALRREAAVAGGKSSLVPGEEALARVRARFA